MRTMRQEVRANIIIDPKTGCWNWRHNPRGRGYPYIVHRGQNIRGNRFSFMAFHGKIPIGLNVLHSCDNPRCVNPDHLFAGTQKRNIRDCIERGRRNSVKGEHHGRAKITEAIAREIKTSKQKSKFFVLKYKLSYALISHIRSGVTWRHV